MPAHAAAFASSSPHAAAPARSFGRFELRRLLGKSAGSMVWLAFDPSQDHEVMLTLPRVQPPDAAALERWSADVRAAARVRHPNLAPVLEIGVQDHWPFVATGREHGPTLVEWLAEHPSPPLDESVGWLCDALHGLAYAHEAGSAHLDLQLHNLLIDERGGVRVMALGAASIEAHAGDTVDSVRGALQDGNSAHGSIGLRAHREAATRDVLACGLLLHRLLAAQVPLDEADTALAAARIAPLGREVVRLPWTTPQPVPEALRAIANRCTASQDRLRYRAARTLLGALSGWRDAHATEGGGPVALLLDRLASVGHLPALPGLGARVARVTSLEGQRTDEIADQVLEDLALSFELLRTLNSAQIQSTQIPGNGPVLTLRRIIALIGIEGVRLAANTLREWPGPLDPAAAGRLKLLLAQVRLAGHTAQALRPAGYDAQVVFLIAVLQNLGRLMLAYHFADEAEQMRQLMKPTPADPVQGASTLPGLDEAAAAQAVLGVDIEALGVAVARHWGLGDDVMHMIRRLPGDAPIRRPDGDADMLRLTASAANEAVDAVTSTTAGSPGAALGRVAQRFGRFLGVDARDLADALRAARDGGRSVARREAAAATAPAAAAESKAPTRPSASTRPAS